MATFLDANIPSIWDRASGGVLYGNGGSNYGTKTPTSPIGPGGVGYNSSNGNNSAIFEEYSDSPTVEFGEQCTITHRFSCDPFTARIIQTNYPRKTLMLDNSSGPFGPNVSRVLSTTAKPIAKSGGNLWELTMVSEAQSFANPPDEFDISIIELNPTAEKHPRYSALTYFQRNIVRNQEVSDFIDVQQVYAGIINQFSSSNNQWQDQRGQALELLYKKQKGEESFYLSAYKIVYSQYFWAPVNINPGGYLDNPFNIIPQQFWTDVNGNNIFRQQSPWNPNLYPPGLGNTTANAPYGLSWLRQTDEQHLNRTWYKLTSTWIGAPIGHFDQEWYSPIEQSLQTTPDLGSIFLS